MIRATTLLALLVSAQGIWSMQEADNFPLALPHITVPTLQITRQTDPQVLAVLQNFSNLRGVCDDRQKEIIRKLGIREIIRIAKSSGARRAVLIKLTRQENRLELPQFLLEEDTLEEIANLYPFLTNLSITSKNSNQTEYLLPDLITSLGLVLEKRFKRLLSLSMCHSSMTHHSLTSLIKGLSSIKKLNLSGNPIGDNGAHALSVLATLKTLNLAKTGITAGGVAALAAKLSRLVSLDLSDNNLSDEGITQLTALKNTIAKLKLSCTGITMSGAYLLVQSLTRLNSICLSRNNLSDKISKKPTYLPTLTKLDISSCALQAQELAILLSYLFRLEVLDISDNPIAMTERFADSTMTVMQRLTNMAFLQKLKVRANSELTTRDKALLDEWQRQSLGRTVEY